MSFSWGDEGIESFYAGQVEARYARERDEDPDDDEGQPKGWEYFEAIGRGLDALHASWPCDLPDARMNSGKRLVRANAAPRLLVAGGRLGKGWAR